MEAMGMSTPLEEAEKPVVTIQVNREYCTRCTCDGCQIIHRLAGRTVEDPAKAQLQALYQQLMAYQQQATWAQTKPFYGTGIVAGLQAPGAIIPYPTNTTTASSTAWYDKYIGR